MTIQDIDHVEFYVGDAQQYAFYLCTAFGFRLCGQGGPETGLPGQRSLLLRQGGIQLLLTSGLHPGHPAARHVSRHGDGVARIALRTDDVRARYAACVAGGATPIAPPTEHTDAGHRVVLAEVGGFGDVTHLLVERDAPGDVFLPGRISLLADPDPADELLHVIDHVAVCLPAGDLDRVVERYGRAFGFAQIFTEHIEVGEQAMNSKVVQSASEGVTLTLIEPDTTRRPGQIDEFLDRNAGAGVQHLAYGTDDIIATVQTLQSRGVHFLSTPASYYDHLSTGLDGTGVSLAQMRETNVLVDRDHWGELFQIFTQSMHVRRTYFAEIIQRHGARTFGSGNIKALYQAVERERLDASRPV